MKETEIQKEKSRRTVRGELALMVAVAINSLGVVLMLSLIHISEPTRH